MISIFRFLSRKGAGVGSKYQSERLIVGAVLALLLAPVAAMGGWALGLQATGNIHVVEPEQLYRAAQLNGSALDHILDVYRIRTVINLRGESDGAPWYNDEVAMTLKHGLVHIDIRMSANREPDEATISKLTYALKESPKPILVHCQSGADRTGLASALYELVVAHRPAAVAAQQLSFRYGHFPWLWSRTFAMDDTFARTAADAR
jgi:protein tyrosine phosphatase (PTP) superfamily phosphohydrolase (DUF442 family)